MIGLLILGQKDIAEGLVRAVEHTFGSRPPVIEAVGVDYEQPPERLAAQIEAALKRVDQGRGVLILADIFGTTHTNVARGLLRRGTVELISGASLPMVLRALTYRHLKMDELIDRTLTGGFNGIICASNPQTNPPPAPDRGQGGRR
jgi:mannose/fructose-specific phosphotransferase system component IIA